MPIYRYNIKNRKFMKQRIRLTEGQLHNIIKKCINEAVNEMEPSTYASLARGRHDQYVGNRPFSKSQTRNGVSQAYTRAQQSSQQAQQAAAHAWNDKYGNGKNGAYMYPWGDGYSINYNDKYGNKTISATNQRNYKHRPYGWDIISDEHMDSYVPSELSQGWEEAKRMNGRKTAIDRKNTDDDAFADYNN